VACPFVSSSTRKSCSTDVAAPHFASGSSCFTFTTRTTGAAGFGSTRRPFFLAPRVARAGGFAARLLGAAGLEAATLAGALVAAFVGRFDGDVTCNFTRGFAADFAADFAAGVAGATLTLVFLVAFGATLAARFSAAAFFGIAFFGIAFFGGAVAMTGFAAVLPAPFAGGAETERFAAVGAVEAGGAAWRFGTVLVPATRRPLAC
jgi:hypothetical protein